MTKEQQILKTAEFVRNKLEGEGTGHDWWHIERVRHMALKIAVKENANLFIVEMSALLHDIADHKFHNGDLMKGAAVSREWLDSIGTDHNEILSICSIIPKISFKGAQTATEDLCLEGKVVQDADRLDAIGAIGIARAFAYGGSKKREIYNPEIKPTLHGSFEAYRKSEGPTINHFYEKLLLLKDKLHTDTAKEIAEHRHNYMQDFLSEFYDEWRGMK